MKNKNPYIEFIKILVIIMVPLIFIEFVIYSNIKPQDFNYFYDIGSEEDDYLSPVARISDKINNSEISCRNLTDQLVYFDIPIPKRANEINLSIKFKDNFPNNSKFSIGAKDQEEWHYSYNLIYDNTIEELIKKYYYGRKDNLFLFKLNEYVKEYSIDDFSKNPPQIKLATDLNITIPEFKINNYQPQEFIINTALRSPKTFYVYIKGNFNVEVWKRDLNWYENEDELNISLYDLNDKLIASEIIEDDGEDDKESDKDNDDEEKGELSVNNLQEGVYKLALKNNGDMLITKIKLNQNKIVLYKEVFLAQSSIYFDNFEEDSEIYFKVQKPLTLTAQTLHDVALQTIYVNDEFLKIKKRNKDYNLNLDSSNDFYKLKSKINDIIIKGPEFFSFSEDSWFNPFEGKNIKYKNDLNYLEKNADYVLVDYLPVQDEGEWKIASLSLNIEEDNLYIKNDKLSMMFNTPHLSPNKNETNHMHIPIDWINITVHKKSWFED